MRRLLVAALILASFAVLGSPAPAFAEWRRIDSPNFVVVGDVSARNLQEIAVKFEGFRETLSRVLTERATATPVPTVVVVFPSDRAFTPFKPLYQGKPVPSISGLFLGSRDVNSIAVVPDAGPDGFRVVFHEYAHLVVANTISNVPTWLSEGLAEYYSTFDVAGDGREALLGKVIPEHVLELRATRLLKLNDLLTVDHRSSLYNESDRKTVFYAQSWALVHRILMGKPELRKELSTYLALLGDGAPAVQAWQQAFGPNMEKELQDYVRQDRFTYTKRIFPEALTKLDARVTPLPPADAEAFLADLLLQQERPDEASVRLASAANLDPENVRVKTVSAMVDVARGDDVSARKRLESIGEPADWLVNYSAGVATADLGRLRGENATPEQVQAARRFFELVRKQRGLMANALARLAMLDLRSAEGATRETRVTIERARLMANGREDYAFAHAQILAQLGEFTAARGVAGPLLRSDNPPEVRESGRSLMGYIADLERNANRKLNAITNTEAAAGVDRPPADAPPPPGFNPVFRDVRVGEQRAEGVLERIECAKGTAVFHVRTSDGSVRASASRMADVDFISYRDDLSGTIGCGPVKDPMRVYLTWRTDVAKPEVKLAVALEFLPKQ
jgi:tetratricopeptide (TPR) repeat protein